MEQARLRFQVNSLRACSKDSELEPSQENNSRFLKSPIARFYVAWLSRHRATFALSSLFILCYAVNFRTTLTGDSQAHLFQTASLRWSNDLTLDEYRNHFSGGARGQLPYFVVETQGHIRSVFNFFPSFLLLPFFSIASWIGGASFQSQIESWGLVGKFTASLMIFGAGWILLYILRGRVSRTCALLALIAFWFGSPLWPASIDYVQSQPLQLFKLAAFAMIFGQREGQQPKFFAAGFLLSASVLCRYQTLPSAAIIAISVIILNFRNKRIYWFLLGGVILVPLAMFYHWIAFGSPIAKGPSLYQAFDAPILITAGKLIINPNKGLLAHSPWTLFAILSPFFLLRRQGMSSDHRRIITVCLLSAIPTLMLYSKTNGWAGGWCWGYRYLTDVLPELILIFALVANHCASMPWVRNLVRASVVLGCCVQCIGAFAYDNQWHAVFDSGFHREAWLWQVRDGEISFYAKRGMIYLGQRRVQLFDNYYARSGFQNPELIQGKQSASATGRARFFVIAHTNPARIRMLTPQVGQSDQELNVLLSGSRLAPQSVSLTPGKWQTVELPSIPFLLGSTVEITIERNEKDSTEAGGRRIAIPLRDFGYPE